ncbi:fluoride efflux transporter CrcB [Halocatena marina]|uniref:Fluoride-specific ion channel FluC n=1 Tax=Halocatena marina TaxID=2934937 RepID=A0ABD5YXN0_9EURY|nr:fluoride efflux transporter CrcB [Halocatena marina]
MVPIEPAHLVGIGGTIGALLRYGVVELVDIESFPLGTFTVNIVGSFVLAVLTFIGANEQMILLLGTGACGSFTTFSTFSFDTVHLWTTDNRTWAILNSVGTLIGAIMAIGLAWVLVRLLG